jgi:hypothetical protein
MLFSWVGVARRLTCAVTRKRGAELLSDPVAGLHSQTWICRIGSRTNCHLNLDGSIGSANGFVCAAKLPSKKSTAGVTSWLSRTGIADARR